MDENYDRQKGWAKFPFEGLPSETLGRNVFVTVLDDKLGFDLIEREPYLADVAMFSTDYLRSFRLWPDTAASSSSAPRTATRRRRRRSSPATRCGRSG
jgi:hypothetical protein